MSGLGHIERIEDFIEECIRLFGGKVVEVRYTEERKKRLISYLKWNKKNCIKKEGFNNADE